MSVKNKLLKHCSIKNVLIVLCVLILLYLIYDTYVVRENFADDGFKTQFDTLFGVTQLEDVKDKFDSSLTKYCDKIKALNALCTKCDGDDLDQPISNPLGYEASDEANLLSGKLLYVPNHAISCADGYVQTAAGTRFTNDPIRETDPANPLQWKPPEVGGNTCKREYCEIPPEYQTTIGWKSGRPLESKNEGELSNPDSVLKCRNSSEEMIIPNGLVIGTSCNPETGEFIIPTGNKLCVSRDYDQVPASIPQGYAWVAETAPNTGEEWQSMHTANPIPQMDWSSVFKCNNGDMGSADIDNTYFGSPKYYGDSLASNNFRGCDKLPTIFTVTSNNFNREIRNGADNVLIPINVNYITFDLDKLVKTNNLTIKDIKIVFSANQITDSVFEKDGIIKLFKVDGTLTNTNKTLISYDENDKMHSFKNDTSTDNLYYLYNKDESGNVINIVDGYYYLVLDIYADGDFKRLNHEIEIS